MTLWLLRHGEAHPEAESDEARKLTPYGIEQVRFIAEQLVDQPLDMILTSPYVRAKETTQVVQYRFYENRQRAAVPVTTVPWITPDDRVHDVLNGLENYYPQYKHLLIVSHQPLLGYLAGWLEYGHKQQIPFGTASLAQFEGSWLGAGSLQLKQIFHADIPR
ncbi:phosphohistidine phosphatase SixA [Thiopseudomonas alkaliphila]|uniref:Phosphohistidine phosphatase SixA n=1 Tax=Thiopseudomonas alkaliphila TaxID=1697053 RepID=A0AAW7DT74_9GAMM|nr:phosphohistidine phosphatase SixA [Thiopseudomonas alkaliphila]MDM1696208.1 phosphohistidine phosphatase SixA [Thiopseudomonas alkaliphila]